ncbi:hypothetical protein EYW49_17220 [Siculibacillus lacustris]|uniref:Uncharacterized protein n=1 Tax=Siculibacillus lacustris TaxID=1549641 RepID=A0A4Q9VI19_9HYPH|nr:hypothetical protein [Siculibacillus lacustris]TBW34840.1 hypothetical protein EYW49_17220 [Siculibacillus lacustris]
MKIQSPAIVAIGFVASLGTALAGPLAPAVALMPIAQTTRIAPPIVESRPTVTLVPAASPTDAARAVVERTLFR